MKILIYPHNILKKKASPIRKIDGALQEFINEMIKTMYKAKGVGLAANQVGELKELIIINVTQNEASINPIVLINPKIIATEGEVIEPEGCLSIPDFSADVKRAKKVYVKGYDRDGKEISLECEGLLAKCIQHEIDHLHGLCFVDRLGPIKKSLFRKKWPKIQPK